MITNFDTAEDVVRGTWHDHDVRSRLAQASDAARGSMVGRQAEFELLNDAFVRSAQQPVAVVVGGEAGIGKSRLLAEFARAVEPEASVVGGQCLDLGSGGVPYAPVVAALRELVAIVGVETVVTAVRDGLDAVATLLPELQPGDPRPRGATVNSARLYELIAVLLETVAQERPLVLILEDLHWADSATLELVQVLVRILRGPGVLLVLTFRSDDVTRGHPLRATLSDLERSRRVSRVELKRLTAPEVAELARALHPDRLQTRQIERLYDRSEGVPLFIEELVDAGDLDPGAPLSWSLRDLLLSRYERLDDEVQQTLRLLASGGSCVPHRLLIEVYDGDNALLDRQLRTAQSAGLLIVHDDHFCFRHALMREAIADDLLPGERVRFHVRYADAYAAELERGACVADELAFHLCEANELERALPASIEAMRQAATAGGFARAAALGEQALSLWEKLGGPGPAAEHIALLQQTAKAHSQAGDDDRSLALYELAQSEAPANDVGLRVELARARAQELANLNRPGATALLETAVAEVDASVSSETLGLLLGQYAARLMLESRYSEAAEVATRALAAAEDAHSPSRISLAHNMRAIALIGDGRIEQGLVELELSKSRADGRNGALLRYYVNASDLMHLLGRYREAAELGAAGMALAHRVGVQRTSGGILATNTVEPLIALGEWDRARQIVDSALELNPPPGILSHLRRAKIWLTLWQDGVEPAASLLARWRDELSQQVTLETQSLLGLAGLEAQLALAQGDPDSAWRAVAFLAREAQPMMPGAALALLPTAAQALAELRAAGRPAPAADEAAITAIARRYADWPSAHVALARFEAESARADAGLWQHLIDVAPAQGAPVQLLPYAQLRLAQALVAVGDRATGRPRRPRSTPRMSAPPSWAPRSCSRPSTGCAAAPDSARRMPAPEPVTPLSSPSARRRSSISWLRA